MASSNLSCSNPKPKQTEPLQFLMERRPKMLKDFLLEDSLSCSSNRFRSFPRRAREDPTSVRNLVKTDLLAGNKPKEGQRLLRSRSKAFQAMINAVKSIHFAAITSPSILPRSLSRRLSRKSSLRAETEKKESEVKITVRIKDIIRWRSFRDLAEEEKSPPLDFASSPQRCTTTTITTTTTGSTSSTPCSSNSSSWCDSDFTLEFLPSDECGEKVLPCVGKDSLKATTERAANTVVGPKEVTYKEKDHHSPVSVLHHFRFEEDDEERSVFSFSQSLSDMERKKQKLIQKLRRFEILAKVDPVNLEKWISLEETSSSEDEEEEGTNVEEEEEQAIQLLNHMKAVCSTESCMDHAEQQLLLDFFIEELSTKRSQQSLSSLFESEMIRQAKAWMSGEDSSATDWGVEHKREACLRDMEKAGKWSKFEEDKEELAAELESELLEILLDELSVHI